MVIEFALASVLWTSPFTLEDAVRACSRHAHLERQTGKEGAPVETVYAFPECEDILRWATQPPSPQETQRDRAIVESVAKAARKIYGPAPDPEHVK